MPGEQTQQLLNFFHPISLCPGTQMTSHRPVILIQIILQFYRICSRKLPSQSQSYDFWPWKLKEWSDRLSVEFCVDWIWGNLGGVKTKGGGGFEIKLCLLSSKQKVHSTISWKLNEDTPKFDWLYMFVWSLTLYPNSRFSSVETNPSATTYL